MNFGKYIFVVLISSGWILSGSVCLAENGASEAAMKRFFPASFAGSIFSDRIEKAVEVKDSHDREVPSKVVQEEKSENQAPKDSKIEFATSDVSKKTFLPPDQTPSVSINPEAPSSIISMIESNRRGDSVTAKAYAKAIC